MFSLATRLQKVITSYARIHFLAFKKSKNIEPRCADEPININTSKIMQKSAKMSMLKKQRGELKKI